MSDDFGWRVRTVLADAWFAEGAARDGATEVRGARLMSAGLPHPQWNSGDVHDAEVDLDAMRTWYAARGVPWGLRVPVGMEWSAGRHLFTKPNMGVAAADVALVDAGAANLGPEVRTDSVADEDRAGAEALVAVDAEGFGAADAGQPQWVTGTIGRAGWSHYLARVGGRAAGATVAVHTDGWAGPALSIFGVTVLAPFRGRGLGALLVSRALTDGIAAGARLAALNPNDVSRPLYARLGFTEVAGCHVFVDLA